MNEIYNGCDSSILQLSHLSQNVSHLDRFQQMSAEKHLKLREQIKWV